MSDTSVSSDEKSVTIIRSAGMVDTRSTGTLTVPGILPPLKLLVRTHVDKVSTAKTNDFKSINDHLRKKLAESEMKLTESERKLADSDNKLKKSEWCLGKDQDELSILRSRFECEMDEGEKHVRHLLNAREDKLRQKNKKRLLNALRSKKS
ncbi:hypothetical protein T484DRAFT_1756935 [Baffinella frigidus]|nr:hypothetical protein T484DRAFT_1756935 [Cryptophyta sp. CCMP2293]